MKRAVANLSTFSSAANHSVHKKTIFDGELGSNFNSENPVRNTRPPGETHLSWHRRGEAAKWGVAFE
jgi:hypothetical protein